MIYLYVHQLILNNIALHIALDPKEQEQVLSCFDLKDVSERTSLLQAVKINRYMYFVKRGCLRMFDTDQNGEEHNIDFYP